MLIMTSMSFAQDDTVSPWSLYGGFTSMGAGEEISIEDVDVDLGRANGFTLGFGYALNEKVTIGAGLGQRGFSVDVPDLFGGDTGFDSNIDAKVDDYNWPEIERNYTYNAQHSALINGNFTDICTFSEGLRTMKLIDYIRSNSQ